jgi:hypothetical protein
MSLQSSSHPSPIAGGIRKPGLAPSAAESTAPTKTSSPRPTGALEPLEAVALHRTPPPVAPLILQVLHLTRAGSPLLATHGAARGLSLCCSGRLGCGDSAPVSAAAVFLPAAPGVAVDVAVLPCVQIAAGCFAREAAVISSLAGDGLSAGGCFRSAHGSLRGCVMLRVGGLVPSAHN